ncbi:uncharacterized protein LOC132874863 [Neoarius graeffei]|uniref:uncharacterized protein LOC132874863 n=1 Tax=Neoarius graeffei TaxID=443677 RepID=UPI00298CCD8E|nr:uncharacterized protein LOC132874863 [Neoarius graeffei]XP_060767300.1 uncharacterized protein LOC132874863 [Neoarius graeffei]XP_060767301.1 uncharacterized protein LOC132874863 [Neoarius graeffei]XP_060767302.1 uncharacterized protein LOC132874863 [Neoarius graeffei]XP_060767304.1 uncharacterized protein LOC132874863 [Neoarius graeffei]XP_060767305.1 uncharacterized protein LOC132874863 [Neoarius graeffei]XP_060767306.1 uncharacterized protein LOC132874863 [Neoarius graeffei]XP_06076730
MSQPKAAMSEQESHTDVSTSLDTQTSPPDISTPQIEHRVFFHPPFHSDTSFILTSPGVLGTATADQLPTVSTAPPSLTAKPSNLLTAALQTTGSGYTQAAAASPLDMDLDTSPSWSSDTSVQRDLPTKLPTPARKLGALALKTPDNWALIFQKLEQQDAQLSKVTKLMARSRFHLEAKVEVVSEMAKTEFTKLSAALTASTQKTENEWDKLLKAIKTIITEEVKNQSITQLEEIRFMVEQLQAEVQQEILSQRRAVAADCGHLSQNMDSCVRITNQINTSLGHLPAHITKEYNILTNKITELEKKIEQHVSTISPLTGMRPSVTPHTTATPASLPSHSSFMPTTPPTGTKSGHLKVLKLSFPTFGKASDDPDPVLYLSKCCDFLAIHPLSDAESLATFRTVLHGTARDWWEIAMTEVLTWAQFQKKFLSAFLSEDYEKELMDQAHEPTAERKRDHS